MRGARLYRALLRAYPATFRARYETEMVRLLRDQLRDAPGVLAKTEVWIRAVADVVLTAPGERVRGEELVSEPVPMQSSAPARPPVSLARRVLSLSPLGAWLVMLAIGASDPVFMNPPSLFGLPIGSLMVGLALVWMALGAALTWRTYSTALWVAALVLFTLPSLVLVIVSPAVILAMSNLDV